MRRILLILIGILVLVYLFLLVAVEDDSLWFHKLKQDVGNNPSSMPRFLEFSFNDVFTTSYSLKYANSDTLWIKQHFASFSSDSIQIGSTYFALIKTRDRLALDSFLNVIDFSQLDSVYYEPYEDGEEYQFYIESGNLHRIVYVHSSRVSSDLKVFASWINNLKINLKHLPSDSIVEFKRIERFIPSKVPHRNIDFSIPRVE